MPNQDWPIYPCPDLKMYELHQMRSGRVKKQLNIVSIYSVAGIPIVFVVVSQNIGLAVHYSCAPYSFCRQKYKNVQLLKALFK